MLNFKNSLIVAEHEEIYTYKLLTAREVEDQNLCNRDDKNFETVCEFVYDWILHTEMSVNELCEILSDALTDGEITIDDIVNDQDKVTEYINHKI